MMQFQETRKHDRGSADMRTLIPCTMSVAACLLFFAPACSVQQAVPGQTMAEPICFSVEVVIDGQPTAENPRRRDTRTVLEASRDLRMISGPSSHAQTYPPFIRRLSHAEHLAIYQHVVEHELIAEPTSPNAEPTRATADAAEPEVVYHVNLNVNGKWHQYATTPPESPPTVQLLALLREASASPHRGL